MVLAELGRSPLQVHFWQQILHYHHRTIALDNVRLAKLAMVDGFALDQTAVKDSWQHYLGGFLHGRSQAAIRMKPRSNIRWLEKRHGSAQACYPRRALQALHRLIL